MMSQLANIKRQMNNLLTFDIDGSDGTFGRITFCRYHYGVGTGVYTNGCNLCLFFQRKEGKEGKESRVIDSVICGSNKKTLSLTQNGIDRISRPTVSYSKNRLYACPSLFVVDGALSLCSRTVVFQPLGPFFLPLLVNSYIEAI